MEQARRRRRRRKTKKTVAAASIHYVPDDLLKLILLRLDSPLWLIRAASTCKRWRSAIAGADEGAAFLRLARSLHPPAVVGHYHDQPSLKDTTITFVPSSLPMPINGNRFSLDFLPFGKKMTSSHWEVYDCHGGLVLIGIWNRLRLSGLIVCDPLTRRYRGIQCPPDHTDEIGGEFAYLLNGEDDSVSISNFRLLGKFHGGGRRPCAFSTADAGGG